MYLVVGLGNPEPEYSNTRHNMGFDVINKVAERYNIDIQTKGFQALYGIGNIDGERVILCKPQTFMNLSGDAVIEVMDFYKLDIEDLIVVYDDMDIEIGSIKVKPKGSSGGHNGIESIIENLQTQDFKKVRVGIGRPKEKNEMINYVIKKVSKEEYEDLSKGIDKAVEAVIEIISTDLDSSMNKFN